MVRKFSKKVHFHNFVLTLARNLNLLKQFIYIHLKVLITLFQKMVKFIGVQDTVRSHVFFLNLISTKNPSNDESVFSNYEGISSLIYSRMPPPFALLSNLGLPNLLNQIVLKEKKNQFPDVSDINAKTSLLMFLRRILSKALHLTLAFRTAKKFVP